MSPDRLAWIPAEPGTGRKRLISVTGRLVVPLGLAALLGLTACASDDGATVATPEHTSAETSAPPAPAPTTQSPSLTLVSPEPTRTPTPSEPPDATRTDPPTPPPAERLPETSLTIVVNTGTAEGAMEWTLSCDPPGGTHPDPEATCAALAEVDPAVFDPVPRDQRCTQVYGGPETAKVTGVLRGERLVAEFARHNGCEIHRWNTLSEVLVAGGDGRLG